MAEMTKEVLVHACKSNKGYGSPHLNDQLYLQCKGFVKVQNLEPYIELKALWLEQNAIGDLSGLGAQQKLVSLMVHNNALITLQHFDAPLSNLRILNVSHNYLTNLKGLSVLCPLLETLQASHNRIFSLEACEDLLSLSSTLTSVDLSFNDISCCHSSSLEEEEVASQKKVRTASEDFPPSFHLTSSAHASASPRGSASLTAVEDVKVFAEEKKSEHQQEEGSLHTNRSDTSPTPTRSPIWKKDDISFNRSSCPSLEATNEVVSFFQTHLPIASVLYLHGNPILRNLKQYRRKMIVGLPSLTYLDERPVFAEERRVVEAWARGGDAEETSERSKIREEKKEHLQSCVKILTDKMEANREVRDRLTREWEKRRDLELEEVSRRRREIRDAKGILEVRESAERERRENEANGSWLDLMDAFQLAHDSKHREEKERLRVYQYEQEVAAVTAEVQREINEISEKPWEATADNTFWTPYSNDSQPLPLAKPTDAVPDGEKDIAVHVDGQMSANNLQNNRGGEARLHTDFSGTSSLNAPLLLGVDNKTCAAQFQEGFSSYDWFRSDEDILTEMEEEIQKVLHQVHTSISRSKPSPPVPPVTERSPSFGGSGGVERETGDGALSRGSPADSSMADVDKSAPLEKQPLDVIPKSEVESLKCRPSLSEERMRGLCADMTELDSFSHPFPTELPTTDRDEKKPNSSLLSGASSRGGVVQGKEKGDREACEAQKKLRQAVRITAERLKKESLQKREERWKEFERWENWHLDAKKGREEEQ